MGSWVLTDGAGVCAPGVEGLREGGLRPSHTGTAPVERQDSSRTTPPSTAYRTRGSMVILWDNRHTCGPR